MPKISIIVPIYKVEQYIHRCVNSILAQTFSDFELILVNDGSPDRCGTICDEYAKKDSRVRVIHKKNGGLSDARNSGLNIAQGEYIGFVDSDDYIESDMYEKLLGACISNKANISICGRYDVYKNEVRPIFSFEGIQVWNSKEAIEKLLTWNNVDSSACDKLFNRNQFDNVRFPLGKYNEDIFIMTKVLFNAKKIVHIGESKYYYYHREHSITTEYFSEKKMDLVDASKEVLDFVKDKYPELNLKAESFYYKAIIYLFRLLQYRKDKVQYSKYYKKLRSILFEHLNSILLNKYIDLRNKIIFLLLITNTYCIVDKLRSRKIEY